MPTVLWQGLIPGLAEVIEESSGLLGGQAWTPGADEGSHNTVPAGQGTNPLTETQREQRPREETETRGVGGTKTQREEKRQREGGRDPERETEEHSQGPRFHVLQAWNLSTASAVVYFSLLVITLVILRHMQNLQ